VIAAETPSAERGVVDKLNGSLSGPPCKNERP
jgi:hypothetical protein